jgi:hypothetical protein
VLSGPGWRANTFTRCRVGGRAGIGNGSAGSPQIPASPFASTTASGAAAETPLSRTDAQLLPAQVQRQGQAGGGGGRGGAGSPAAWCSVLAPAVKVYLAVRPLLGSEEGDDAARHESFCGYSRLSEWY